MEVEKQNVLFGSEACVVSVMAVRDALYVLNGKWKFPILVALLNGPKRFNELQRVLGEVTPKILSKELKELEMNEFIERRVSGNAPVVAVIYELTPYSESLNKVLDELRSWGIQHRQRITASRRRAS